MPIAKPDSHIFQSTDDFDPAITTPSGGGTSRHFLGERHRESSPGPEAFLVEQAPAKEVDTHFHPVDQFQIFFGAPGAYYRRHPIPKVLLHYADAYAVYGPFGAGPDAALNLFTLRGAKSNFHGSMPRCRDQLLYRGERHYEVDLEAMLNEGVPAKGDSVVSILMEPHPDGLAAHLVRVGARTEISPPSGDLRTGRYTVVLEGELNYEGKSFGPKSVGWSSGDIPDVVLEAGSNGAAALFLYLPFPATPSVHLSN